MSQVMILTLLVRRQKSGSFGWFVSQWEGGSRTRPQLLVKNTALLFFCFYSIQRPSKRLKTKKKLQKNRVQNSNFLTSSPSIFVSHLILVKRTIFMFKKCSGDRTVENVSSLPFKIVSNRLSDKPTKRLVQGFTRKLYFQSLNKNYKQVKLIFKKKLIQKHA